MARRRLAKRQRSDQEKDDAASAADAPPPAGNQQPSKITRFLSIVPFLQPKMADSAWASLNERFGSEKPVPAVPAVPPVPRDPPRYSQQSRTPPPQLNLQLNQSRPESGEAQAQAPAVDANGNPKIRLADVDEQGLSATGDTLTTTQQMDPRSQYRPPPVSPTGSSISSAFGNGTFIPPTPRDAPQGLRDTMRSDYFAGALPPQSPLMPPPPVMAAGDGGSVSGSQRDTIYTQSSMSSTPRFRTVSSWVGQQTRRIRREPAADVPEQGYGLMMPDGQEPRRVDEVPPVPSLPPQVQERGV